MAHRNEWPKDAECPDKELLAWLTRKTGFKGDPDTPRGFCRMLARLGGFLGRKGDGEPRWQAIWDGLLRAIAFLDAVEHLSHRIPILNRSG